MTSNIDQTQWNTRERAVSSDLNRNNRLLHRAISEALSFIASGATKRTGCFGDSFIATPQAGTMKTTIGTGLALVADSSQTYPDSTAVWIESREIREVTHDAADAQTRFDVIEMRAGQLVSSTQARDVFDPVTGAFSVQNLTKEIKAYPEFRITKGTPALVPAVPAGSSGWIPLAYVRVPGGAVSLTATDVIYCRPILAAQDPAGAWVTPTPTRHATRVRGGGVAAAGAALVATLANDMSGRFPGYYMDFRLAATSELRVTTLTWDGTGLPAADGAVYFYAVPPMYPAGYDSHLAGREFWTPDVVNAYSTSGGFYSSTRQEGCIVVASATPPADLGHPAGYASGNGTFAHSLFSTANSSSARSSWVYIGAASFELAGNQLVTQKHANGLTATQRKPGKSFFADLPIAGPTQYNLWTEVTGNPVVRWPTTAREIQMHVHAEGNNNSWLRFEGFDDLGDDGGDAGILTNVFNNISGAAAMLGTMVRATLDTSGRYTIRLASHTACTSAKLVANCYRDAVLDRR
jgi:hypothetical protein